MMLEAVIGLEVHVQLRTATKLFCADRSAFGEPPNTLVCPVCLGLPGALPVLNADAVALATRAAVALGCTVHELSTFERKSYFYPDLPKGYQITQHAQPLATAGVLEMRSDGGDALRIAIRRLHLEEDAGRTVHDRVRGATAVDLNRAGVPLIEIVTEPDLRSPEQARAFLELLQRTLRWLGVSDCDMEKGSLRVDANVSVRPAGTRALAERTELKNMNSFSGVERALRHEIERQRRLVADGGSVGQATLSWDAARSQLRELRSKEQLRDYRYMPEPDLPPLLVPRAKVERITRELPELPAAREDRFVVQYGLLRETAHALTADARVADYFEAVAALVTAPRTAANWVVRDVLAWQNAHGVGTGTFPVPADRLAELVRAVVDGAVSGVAAREVLLRMAETGDPAGDVIHGLGLQQVSDDAEIERWLDVVVDEHPAEAARLRAGETRMLDFLMGQIMARSRGRADPRRAAALLRARLEA